MENVQLWNGAPGQRQFFGPVVGRISSHLQRIRLNGGLAESHFELEGDIDYLRAAWQRWPGWEIRFTLGGERMTGLIQRTELRHGRRRLIRSLEDTFNHVRAEYHALGSEESDELLDNGGFEEPAAVDEGVRNPGFETLNVNGLWSDWSLNANGATIASSNISHSGNRSARMTGNGSIGYIFQNVIVRPNRRYRLSFWHRNAGSGGKASFQLFNNKNGGWITVRTTVAVGDTIWRQENFEFTAAADCRRVHLRLFAPLEVGWQAFYDDVSVEEIVYFADWEHEWGAGAIGVTAAAQGGLRAVTLSGGSYLGQRQRVAAGSTYRLEFASKGNGTAAARIAVRDQTNGNDLVALSGTGNSSTSFVAGWIEFVVPDDCGTVEVQLHSPTGSGSGSFDEVSLKRKKLLSYLTESAVDELSAAEFGMREKILVAPLQPYSLEAAEGRRDLFLAAHGRPRTERRLLTTGSSDETRLLISYCGFAESLNWSTAQISEPVTVEQAIRGIAMASEQLRPGLISANGLLVESVTLMPAGRLLERLTALGDGAGGRYRFVVDEEGRLHYMPMSPEPEVYQLGEEFFRSPGGVAGMEPEELRPGVYRDGALAAICGRSAGWLKDDGSFLVEEARVGSAGVELVEGGAGRE